MINIDIKFVVMKTKYFLILFTAITVVLNGCFDVINDSEQAKIQFLLTDMPGEYQEVNIDITAVNIIINDSLIELVTNQGIYNILEFVNGKDTVLVTDEIPTGYLNQIRLILGENNTVMVDGVVYDMKTPSAQQSGLKLNVHQEFLPGTAYTYIIDFVAEKSIVKTGNGKYILKPVIRVFTEAITGSVQGVVRPVAARPLILAINENDTSSTYADKTTGDFIIRGLPESTYSLEFHPVEGFKDTTLTDIGVYPGQTTLIDTLSIK